MGRSSALRLRSIAVALAASACLIGGVRSAQAAPAGAEAVQGGEYKYRNAASGECLDARARSHDLGTVLQQFDCKSGLTKEFGSPEVRTFTGNGIGTSPSEAVEGAVRIAYANAQSAGWQANQCHVRATDVRSVGGGVYAAVASLFCQH